jgi:hypothetical protein
MNTNNPVKIYLNKVATIIYNNYSEQLIRYIGSDNSLNNVGIRPKNQKQIDSLIRTNNNVLNKLKYQSGGDLAQEIEALTGRIQLALKESGQSQTPSDQTQTRIDIAKLQDIADTANVLIKFLGEIIQKTKSASLTQQLTKLQDDVANIVSELGGYLDEPEAEPEAGASVAEPVAGAVIP